MTYKKIFFNVSIFIIIVFVLVGCAKSRYLIYMSPTVNLKSFVNIEVSAIELESQRLNVEIPTLYILRHEIIKAIQKSNMYQKVANEIDTYRGTLLIKCKIVEFDKGNRVLRYFIGMGAGKAYLKSICLFYNKENGQLIATGTFSGEIESGFFGGSVDQNEMVGAIVKAIVLFLKKGV